MKRAVAGAVVALSSVLWSADQRAYAQSPGDAGKATFSEHCASCHGESGHGDGPRGAGLTTKPADLTRLSARHNGEFPTERIADIVRNGSALLGHTTEMPAWSTVFGVKGDPSVARARIDALARYLETLQQK
jgi:mono/diheme cytochrome c family protein